MIGQTSFEYMAIVIIIIAFLVPVWIYVSQTRVDTAEEFSLSYAKNAVNKIASSADLVYSQRMNARVKIAVYIPNGVEEVSLENKRVNMKVSVSGGVVDVFATSLGELQGEVPTNAGFYWFLLESMGNYVNISMVS